MIGRMRGSGHDYHLAKGNLAEAERLINETGYHRRDRAPAELRARVKP
jgi:hypothetical protein